jgi:hypothetical protein
MLPDFIPAPSNGGATQARDFVEQCAAAPTPLQRKNAEQPTPVFLV